MSSMETTDRTDVTAELRGMTPTAPLITIVGYDGTETSRQSIRAATALIGGRDGRLHVVWVAHTPAVAVLSAAAEVGIAQAFGAEYDELSREVGDLIGHDEQRWTFHRRDGAVAHELLKAAEELRDSYGGNATIVIVVGASVHAYHQVMGSVPVSLARQGKFPLLVVPVADSIEPAPSTQ